ncbi:15029_t:CDS:1, partial [Acaulospora colombiana]
DESRKKKGKESVPEVEFYTLDVGLDLGVNFGAEGGDLGALFEEASDSRFDHAHSVFHSSLDSDVLVDSNDGDEVVAVTRALFVVEGVDIVGPGEDVVTSLLEGGDGGMEESLIGNVDVEAVLDAGVGHLDSGGVAAQRDVLLDGGADVALAVADLVLDGHD